MSDVEKICDLNHQRARWAGEYADPVPDLYIPTEREVKKCWKRQRIMRTAAQACVMITGMGAAFVGMGIASLHLPTLIVGAVAALVFLVSGFAFEAKADEALEEVMVYE